MKEYLENTLKSEVEITTSEELYDKLPLAFKGKYIFFKVKTNKLYWYAIKPKLDLGLVTLKNDFFNIERITDLNCAFVFTNISYYIKEKLIEYGISFLIVDKQMFLPFIGVVFTKKDNRQLKTIDKISYLTQKMLLTAIYGDWKEKNVTQIAEILDISKMSVSRCFDELEYFNIDVIKIKNKARVITVPKDKEHLWEEIRPILRNPVIKTYEFKDDLLLDRFGGVSALSNLSLVSDNDYPTYVVTKKEVSKLEKDGLKSKGEETGSMVLELGYYVGFDNNMDPLSIDLSLNDEQEKDERIAKSIKQMLKDNVWSKD